MSNCVRNEFAFDPNITTKPIRLLAKSFASVAPIISRNVWIVLLVRNRIRRELTRVEDLFILVGKGKDESSYPDQEPAGSGRRHDGREPHEQNKSEHAGRPCVPAHRLPKGAARVPQWNDSAGFAGVVPGERANT